MGRLKQFSSILFSVALGLVFLYSAYSKLDPVIETFEFTFVELGIANWYTAPVFARLLIAIEIFTGLLLIACYRLKALTIPLTAGLLLFFTIYLLLQIALIGNSGNCGCSSVANLYALLMLHHLLPPLVQVMHMLLRTHT